MLDVLHVLYEEDMTPRFEQDIEIKDKIRGQLYPILYNRPYKFGSPSATRQYGADGEYSGPPVMDELPVESRATKPYIPPTNIDDLPGVLEPPLR